MWKKRDGSLGVCYLDRHDADVIHDLNVFSYPFRNIEFSEIYLDNVLKHLKDQMRVIQQVHHICKIGKEVKAIIPYFGIDIILLILHIKIFYGRTLRIL